MTSRSGAIGGMVLLACCALQGACVAADPSARQYQDEATAVTVTTTVEPLVLAREVSLLAVNARDYLSLFPVEVNRAGQRRYYLFGYSWSTIDRRGDARAAVAGEVAFNLRADDRDIVLKMAEREFQSAALSALPVPAPVPAARPLLFPVDRATLLFVGTARVLSAHSGDAPATAPVEPYRLWKRPGGGLNAFLERIGPVQSGGTPSR